MTFHRDWQAARQIGFGSAVVTSALASGTSPLAPSLDRYTFEDPDAERQDTLDYISTVRPGVGNPRAPFIKEPIVTYSDIAGWEEPVVARPFLVLKVDWLGDGTDIGYYSEADIATSEYQLHGRVTGVGTFTRAFGVDSTVQRSTVSVELEDIDRVFATHVRSNNHLRAKFTLLVGSPHVAPRSYHVLAADYRVLDVQGITETGCSFTLIDGAEDLSGISIRPPTLADMFMFADIAIIRELSNGSREWFEDWRFPNDIVKNRGPKKLTLSTTDTLQSITIPFAGSIYKAPFASVLVPESKDDDLGWIIEGTHNPVMIVVLGASKNPAWMRSHYYGGCKDRSALGAESEPIIYAGGVQDDNIVLSSGLGSRAFVPSGLTGLRAYVSVSTAQPEGESEPWYIATLFVSADPRPLNAGSTTQGGLRAHAKRLKERLRWMKANISDVFIDANGFGASNTWGDFSRVNRSQVTGTVARADAGPIGVIKYLARYHSGRGVAALTGPNRILEDVDDAATALGSDRAGCVISGETDGASVLSEVCASFNLDVGLIARGRLTVRPQAFTTGDRNLRMPTAREFTDGEHIIADSWEELAPKGSDRMGFGTVFKFSGVQEQLEGTNGFAPEQGFRPNGNVEIGLRGEVEKRVNISWRRQDPDFGSQLRTEWVLPHTSPRYGARFRVPLTLALGLELGDFVRVTHYAGSNEDGSKGWDRRLCRVDSVTPDWPNMQTELVVFDWAAASEAKVWVLDNQDYWALARPFSIGDYADTTASSADVTFSGTIFPTNAWVGAEFRISRAYNPRPYPARDFTTYLPTESQCVSAIIQSVNTGTRTVTLDRVYGETYRVRAWRVNYTHTLPPTDPYKYPFGSDVYGRLCDAAAIASDGTIGAFSNGDPGYRMGDKR